MNKGLSEELKPRRGGRVYWARRASPGGGLGVRKLPFGLGFSLPGGASWKKPSPSPGGARAFPNNIGVARPLVPDYIIPDPQWIAGFTSGEGSFMIKLSKSPASKLGFGVQLIFQLTQNNRADLSKVPLLIRCGGKLVRDGTKIVYIVSKFSSIIDTIIPFSTIII